MYGQPPPHSYAHDAPYAAYIPQPVLYPPHPGYASYPASLGAPYTAYPNNVNAPSDHESDHESDQESDVKIVHTDDATTKVSDTVRRRCFNCCATETSTWRRSSLSPGKVLCNKCGLYERTHQRMRPELPHKRGMLSRALPMEVRVSNSMFGAIVLPSERGPVA
ncbi:hypothetical protein DFH06DRAFT_987423 [Mycena polygramma]|nr:hypothetical protein DFH06DRAFT_987423 [Mycena polygramma]